LYTPPDELLGATPSMGEVDGLQSVVGQGVDQLVQAVLLDC